METWQREQIQRNMSGLIRLTTCNVEVVSMLLEANLLSQIEEQELRNASLVPIERAKRMFEILETRNNSYNILRNILQKTRQTGALEILDDGLLIEVMQQLEEPLSRKDELRKNINAQDEFGETLLHKTVASNKTKQLEHLKLLEADLEAKNAKGETPLLKIAYCEQDCTKALMWFIDQDVNLNATDKNGSNLVLLAVQFNRPVSLIDSLISLGLVWNVTNNNGETVLHVATKTGNVEILEYFKNMGSNINVKCNLGRVPLLHLASTHQNFANVLSWFYKQNASLNVTDAKGNNLIFLMVAEGHGKSELEHLVNLGADWKVKNADGQSVIHVTALAGNLEALKYFKSLGADIDTRDNSECTSLLKTPNAKQNFCKMLAWFSNQGADLSAADKDGNNLVLLSIKSGRSIDELEYVIKLGVNWNVKNKDGNTVLHLAAQFGSYEMLNYFKSLGADVDARNKEKETPLLRIAYATNSITEKILWFVERNIDIHAVDYQGNNLALLSAFEGRSRTQLVEIAEFGIDWKQKNNFGQGILHAAAQGGNVEALEYFIDLGADIKERDNNENTPLLHVSSCSENFTETLQWLFRHDTNPCAVCFQGSNLAHLCAFNGKSRAQLEQVVGFGIDWKRKDKHGIGILHLAAQGGNFEALEYFVSLGADIEERDNSGKTPLLHLAFAKRNFVETLSWFVEAGVNLNAVDSGGNNLAFLSATHGRSSDDIQAVLLHDVDWKIKNNRGQTILQFADKNPEAVALFKTLGASCADNVENSGCSIQ